MLFLASAVLYPFLDGYRDRAFDHAYDWLDAQGMKVGWLTKHRCKKANSLAPLEDKVRKHLEKHPEDEEKLAAAALATVKAENPDDDVPFLTMIMDALTEDLNEIHRLRRPVVLPGFLTGINQLAVIDVRSRTANRRFAELGIFPAVPTMVQSIRVFDRRSPTTRDDPWQPRIWLLADDRRTKHELEEAANNAPETITPNDAFVDLLKGEKLVTRITKRNVFLQSADKNSSGEVYLRSYDKEEGQLWADTSVGFMSMHKALGELIQAQREREAGWALPRTPSS